MLRTDIRSVALAVGQHLEHLLPDIVEANLRGHEQRRIEIATVELPKDGPNSSPARGPVW